MPSPPGDEGRPPRPARPPRAPQDAASPPAYRPALPAPAREELSLEDRYSLDALRAPVRKQGSGIKAPPRSGSEGYFGPRAQDGSTTPRRLPPIQAPKDFVSQLASRLKHCEAENENLKTLLSRANKQNRELQEQVRVLSEASVDSHRVTEELMAMRAYISQLQDQIFGMEEFLSANGLAWVEDWRRDDPSGASEDASAQTPPARPAEAPRARRRAMSIDGGVGLAERGVGPSAAASEPAPGPASGPRQELSPEDRELVLEQLDALSREPWRCPAREAIERSVAELNKRIGVEARMREYGGANVLSYADRPTIPVTIYENGIFVKRGPFRGFENESARRFVEDLAAGYLPGEFRAAYPEGINLDVRYSMDTKFQPGAQPATFGKGGRRLEERQSGSPANAPDADRMLAAMGDRGILQRAARDQTADELAEIRAAYVQPGNARAGAGKSVHSFLTREDDLQKPMPLAQFLRRLPASVSSGGRIVPIRQEIARAAGGAGGARVEDLGGTIVIDSSAFSGEAGGEGAGVEEGAVDGVDDGVAGTAAGDGLSGAAGADGSAEGSAAPPPPEPSSARPLATLRLRVHSSDPALQNRNLMLKCPFDTAVRSVLAQAARALGVPLSAASLVRPFGGDLMEALDSTLEAAGLTPNARLFLRLA